MSNGLPNPNQGPALAPPEPEVTPKPPMGYYFSNLACPYCNYMLFERAASGIPPKTAYHCLNQACSDRPQYRRTDEDDKTKAEYRRSADEVQAQQAEAFLTIRDDQNQVVRWIKAIHPAVMDGSGTFAAITIALLERGLKAENDLRQLQAQTAMLIAKHTVQAPVSEVGDADGAHKAGE